MDIKISITSTYNNMIDICIKVQNEQTVAYSFESLAEALENLPNLTEIDSALNED